jgi:formate-dependent nitrite reductase membrane component NrfD
MVAIGAEIVLIALFLLDLATGPQTAQAAAREFLGGSWTGPFWALVVLAGLLVPLVMEGLEVRRRLTPTIATAALVLIGGLSLRFILLLAGQQSSFGIL